MKQILGTLLRKLSGEAVEDFFEERADSQVSVLDLLIEIYNNFTGKLKELLRVVRIVDLSKRTVHLPYS
ncbi:hypothetical protein RCC89_07295 [Cytophagaceae bacterium ABcell3]|nr:hypothetical protein RCC89_07295 [Cytophagaceae bacterium ABcell3]